MNSCDNVHEDTRCDVLIENINSCNHVHETIMWNGFTDNVTVLYGTVKIVDVLTVIRWGGKVTYKHN